MYAFEQAGPTDRLRLGAVYRDASPSAAAIAEVVEILERTGARAYTRDQARHYRDVALAELEAAGTIEPAAREQLEGIIDSVISA